MRCGCCNKRLSDYEATLKHAVTGVYLDTCIDCLSEIAQDVPMPVQARKDLINSEDFTQGVDDIDDTLYNNYTDNKEDTEDDN